MKGYISLVVLMLAWLITFNDGTKLWVEKAGWVACKRNVAPWIEVQVDGKRMFFPWASIKMIEEL